MPSQSHDPETILNRMNVDGAQAKIDKFCNRWWKDLLDRCGDNNQRQACWFLWTRYLMALRSLRHLYAVDDIAGSLTLARCCNEYDVAVSAIAKQADLGRQYIEYDAHARNRHFQEIRGGLKEDRVKDIQDYMTSRFGPDYATKKKSTWCSFRTLCKKAERPGEYATYIAQCQVAHGTVTGMHLLDRLGIDDKASTRQFLRGLMEIHTLAFLPITQTIIEVIFGSLWEPCKDKCSTGLEKLAASILGVGTDVRATQEYLRWREEQSMPPLIPRIAPNGSSLDDA